MGKANRQSIFFHDADGDDIETERERGPMTWLHKYEMCVACCWHIMAKDRLQIHTHKHTGTQQQQLSPFLVDAASGNNESLNR